MQVSVQTKATLQRLPLVQAVAPCSSGCPLFISWEHRDIIMAIILWLPLSIRGTRLTEFDDFWGAERPKNHQTPLVFPAQCVSPKGV